MIAFQQLVPDWHGGTVVVMGNGPSVETFGLAHRVAPGVRVCVSNGGYLFFPKADQLMLSDRHWIAAHPDLSGYLGPCILVTQPRAVLKYDPRMRYLRRRFIASGGDMFQDPGTLVEGHTSVSTNISAAVLRGAAKIILVGVDLRTGADGRRRAGEVTADNSNSKARYARMVDHLTQQSVQVLARGVRVFNASPESALACYPYLSLEEAQNA